MFLNTTAVSSVKQSIQLSNLGTVDAIEVPVAAVAATSDLRSSMGRLDGPWYCLIALAAIIIFLSIIAIIVMSFKWSR